MTRPHLAILAATSGHSGVDRVLRNLAGELLRRGYRLDLLQVRGHGPDWSQVGPGGRVLDLGRAHVNTSLGPLVSYLRRHRPMALLSDKDKVNRLALWARRIAGVDTQVAVRMGTTVSKNLERRGTVGRWLQYQSIRRFYPWADAIVVPSRGAAADLAAIARIPPERVRVVPSPVATPELAAQAAAPVDHPWLAAKDRPVVLGVGELSARKDFATTLAAFARLRRGRPARLVILGEGRKRSELEAQAAALGIAADLDLPGFVANPYAYMARADVVVLSSICEGAPVVLMEALAVGTPVVATDCPSGPREILEGGRYGGLVPVGAVDALATALAAALDTPPPREALLRAAERYTVAAAADAYLQALGLGTAP